MLHGVNSSLKVTIHQEKMEADIMTNNETMTLTLERIKILDIKMAIQTIIFDFEKEIKNEETSDERKRIAQKSIDHRWKPLLEAVKKQFEEQDK